MKSTRTRVIAMSLVALAALGWLIYSRQDAASTSASAGAAAAPVRRVAVSTTHARRGDMDVVITALGTITARETVTVHSRVDGELMRVHFREGQHVAAGDLLAEIDPRPFQIALDQANGQLQRDRALLENARVDLARYRDLLKQDSIATQQVDAQAALVQQYQGVVLTDSAAVENAKLQMVYARITAPIAGRLGLRQIDAGNLVHASDTGGLVVITATAPISAVFTVPSEQLPAIRARLRDGAELKVEAFDRDGRQRLASGRLQSLDNQIDTATATLKLKAEFENRDETLFPNQFVNIALHVATRRDAILIPSAAVQRGQAGAFVYVIDAERTARLRKVELGPAAADEVVVETGVADGETIVTEGVDKLHDGVVVAPVAAAAPAAARAADIDGAPASK